MWSQEGGWPLRDPVDPLKMVAVDTDNDRVEELAASFRGYGLWRLDEKDRWHWINDFVRKDMKPINFYP